MIRGLYDTFAERWYHDGSVWFYSDPHFGDAEMYALRGDGITAEEQVKRINSKIGKKDTIIFLGDIGDARYIKDIRGHKVLVMGNHDAGATNYTEYFDEIYEGVLMIGPKIILSHEPITMPFAVNIHGHVHSTLFHKDSMHINVCAEHIDYTPICLSTLIKSGAFKDAEDIHRLTIDTAIIRKAKRKH